MDDRAQALVARGLTCPAHGWLLDGYGPIGGQCLSCRVQRHIADERLWRVWSLGAVARTRSIAAMVHQQLAERRRPWIQRRTA